MCKHEYTVEQTKNMLHPLEIDALQKSCRISRMTIRATERIRVLMYNKKTIMDNIERKLLRCKNEKLMQDDLT